MRHSRALQARGAASLRILLVIMACLSAEVLLSQPPEPQKISTFAPAADLTDQVDVYIKQVGEALADRDEFESFVDGIGPPAGDVLLDHPAQILRVPNRYPGRKSETGRRCRDGSDGQHGVTFQAYDLEPTGGSVQHFVSS